MLNAAFNAGDGSDSVRRLGRGSLTGVIEETVLFKRRVIGLYLVKSLPSSINHEIFGRYNVGSGHCSANMSKT